MTETVRFFFDPLCPWAWQGARWIRAVSEIRDVHVDWRLFSLEIVNSERGRAQRPDSAGSAALRTLAMVRRLHGNEAVGRAYGAMGSLLHERHVQLSNETIERALGDADFDPGILRRALNDESTMEQVRADHSEAVEKAGCFGVPTIALASGKGIFGPVVATAPAGEDAGELWDRVRWLIELDGFFELKRDRDRTPTSTP
jgi:2-hydroxychromene-2-carboxylate isomerase